MTVQISHINKANIKTSYNQVLFTNKNLDINNLKKDFTKDEGLFIKDILKKKNNKKGIFLFNVSSKKKLILIPVKEDLDEIGVEKLGAEFYNFIKKNLIYDFSINSNSLKIKTGKNFLERFLHGLKLKSHEFNIYKSKNEEKIYKIYIIGKNKFNKYIELNFKALEDGTNFARDLVSEPPNVLNPKEYVNRLKKLRKIGIKVTVYNEAQLKKLGMHSLLGVGRGSVNESFLVSLEWNGNKKDKKAPLSFVGKGVCFDTGGISLKPARFMEEMKYDMAGSAVVAGLINNLAIRKAKVNAVGVLGLVENMPGGNAQEKKFKPKFIIDLATLTGAIIISLGEEYAGLFSNNDELSNKIFNSGEKVNEKVWRLPLHKNYDKLINSKIADVQNINYSGGAGSITAAQFLQRFILNKTPWAHLDIAGMAFSKKAANLNPGGATGFGVRLLNKLIEEHYE